MLVVPQRRKILVRDMYQVVCNNKQMGFLWGGGEETIVLTGPSPRWGQGALSLNPGLTRSGEFTRVKVVVTNQLWTRRLS